MQDKLLLIAQTLIATALVFFAWGMDAPIYNFALCFGGFLFGHVLTLVLEDREEGEEA